MRVFSKTTMGRGVIHGTDAVIGHVALPAMSKLLNVWGMISIWADTGVPIEDVLAYACRGAVLDVGDTDNALTLDGLWDAVMPKDVDISATAGQEQLDFERTTADTREFSEIGEVNPLDIWSIKGPTETIFDRKRIMNFGSSPTGFNVTGPVYHPRDHFSARVAKKYSVDSMSYVLFAVGSPDVASETATIPQVVNDFEWFLLGYLEYVLEQAWMQVVGLTEAGAETPFADLSTFLERMVEPPAVLDTVMNFDNSTYMTLGELTFEIQVPGKPQFGVVSGG